MPMLFTIQLLLTLDAGLPGFSCLPYVIPGAKQNHRGTALADAAFGEEDAASVYLPFYKLHGSEVPGASTSTLLRPGIGATPLHRDSGHGGHCYHEVS